MGAMGACPLRHLRGVALREIRVEQVVRRGERRVEVPRRGQTGSVRAVLNEKKISRPQPKCRKKGDRRACAPENFWPVIPNSAIFPAQGKSVKILSRARSLRGGPLRGKKSRPLRTAPESVNGRCNPPPRFGRNFYIDSAMIRPSTSWVKRRGT